MIASRRTTPAEWLEIATVTVLSHFRGTREILNPRPPRTYGLPLAVPALLKRKKDTMLSKIRLEVRNKTMARARGKDDFDSFISEAPIALAEDTTPLQWWCSEDVRTAYPRLSRMAIDIL
jgi:hypothetical protein